MSICCIGMGNIELFCGGGNVFGLWIIIKIVCKDQVEMIFVVVDGIILIDIIMVVDCGDGSLGFFFEINIFRDNVIYMVENLGIEENLDFEYMFNFNIFKMILGKNVKLDVMNGSEIILIFFDCNDYEWFMGNFKEGVSFVVLFQINDFNGYVCIVKWWFNYKFYNYIGNIVILV